MVLDSSFITKCKLFNFFARILRGSFPDLMRNEFFYPKAAKCLSSARDHYREKSVAAALGSPCVSAVQARAHPHSLGQL
ncbi:hypothetical protein HNR23_003466 [Nocardiopsis mwathae]|uniref:Uncharacterized protein n=1 Tax=Nocardiopsis mwathae TaxID=1472723 RepID=A0A7X0D764_9ACTN|nr:hypothetical protein [Nocardiopsis mwathae]MBB6173406.1 hypothetical protein [Nocardiopsis mwathae]